MKMDLKKSLVLTLFVLSWTATQALAGEITGEFVGTTLILEADDGDNSLSIQINPGPQGYIMSSPTGDTITLTNTSGMGISFTANGSSAVIVEVQPANLTNINITMNGGADTVTVASALAELLIRGNGGNDAFNILGSITGEIRGGTDQDTILLANGAVVTGVIYGQADDDTLVLSAAGSTVEVIDRPSGFGFKGSAPQVSGGFNGINAINTTASNNELLGIPSKALDWILDGSPTMTIISDPLSFSGFSRIIGRGSEDNFTISANSNLDIGLEGVLSTVSLSSGAALTGAVGCEDNTDPAGLRVLEVGGDGAMLELIGTAGDSTSGTVSGISGGFDCMQGFIATGAGSTFTGLDSAAVWDISADQVLYTIAGITPVISGFANLAGGSDEDTFNVQTSRTLNLDGGAGEDLFTLNHMIELNGAIDGGEGVDVLEAGDDDIVVTPSGADLTGYSGTLTQGGQNNKLTQGFSGLDSFILAGSNNQLIGASDATSLEAGYLSAYESPGAANPLTGIGFQKLVNQASSEVPLLIRLPINGGADIPEITIENTVAGAMHSLLVESVNVSETSVVILGSPASTDTLQIVSNELRDDAVLTLELNDPGSVRSGSWVTDNDAAVTFSGIEGLIDIDTSTFQDLVLDLSAVPAGLEVDKSSQGGQGIEIDYFGGTLVRVSETPTTSVTLLPASGMEVLVDSLSSSNDFDANLTIISGNESPLSRVLVGYPLTLASGHSLTLEADEIEFAEHAVVKGNGNLTAEATDLLRIGVTSPMSTNTGDMRLSTDGLLDLNGFLTTTSGTISLRTSEMTFIGLIDSSSSGKLEIEQVGSGDFFLGGAASPASAGSFTQERAKPHLDIDATELANMVNFDQMTIKYSELTIRDSIDLVAQNVDELILDGWRLYDLQDALPDITVGFLSLNTFVWPGGPDRIGTLDLNVYQTTVNPEDCCGYYYFEIAGNTPGTGYDQIKFGDLFAAFNIEADKGGTVFAEFIDGYVPDLSEEYVVMDIPLGSSGVQGQFKYPNQGQELPYNGVNMQFDIRGGTGNDVSFLVTSVPSANLSISIDDGVNNVIAGESVTYTMTAANVGPDDASGIPVVADFTSGTCDWTFEASGGALGASADSGSLLSQALDLPSGAEVTYTIACPVSASARGQISASATIGGEGGLEDPDSANNADQDTTDINEAGELAISVDNGQDTVSPGEALSYTISLSNDGPSDGLAIPVVSTFPTSLTNVSWTCVASGSGSACAAGGSGSLAENVDIGSMGEVVFTVMATVDNAATGDLVVSATLTPPPQSVDAAENNSDSDTDPIVDKGDEIFGDGFEQPTAVEATQ